MTDAGDDSFLGVERSLTGRRWRARLTDDRAALALAQRLGVPEIVGRVLAARGVALDDADDFLNPTLRRLLPDPASLRDMDKAAARLVRAVTGGEQIAVFGDYDVDGATSSALLARFFAAVGVPLRIYIPDRLAEGYGPNAPALLRLHEEGIGLVVTVDCGITAFEPLEAAAQTGLDVIVVDHHVAEPRLPAAAAVVNPNRLDDDSSQGQLAAVGVVFLLAVAVNRDLRAAGWYGAGRAEPDLLQWLDLVALGTVCDQVPLVGLNRALVAQGLRVMARRGNAGLAALADVGRVQERPGAYHLGFVIGPRVNAGGRVGEAVLGAQLLATADVAEAAQLAERLDGYNRERQVIEAAVLEAALAQTEAGDAAAGPVVFAVGDDWHPGVIGIVASRLTERFNRPACVVSLAGGVGKGSGRSVPGVALGPAVIAARQAGLLVNGGGHAMAAGFTVAPERLPALRDFLAERFADQVPADGLVPSLAIDAALQPTAATPELLALLEQAGPYGAGHPTPRFAVSAARITHAAVVGEHHVRCVLTGAGGGRLNAIAFRAMDGALGPALLQSGGLPLHLAGRLRPDNWRGRDGVQLIVEDAAPAGQTG
jgi:single-stranded-DNA-specific exonuclease